MWLFAFILHISTLADNMFYNVPLIHPFRHTHSDGESASPGLPIKSKLEFSVLLRTTLECEQDPTSLWLMENQLYSLTHSCPSAYKSPSRGLPDWILI